jgi:hypothetical protein
MIRRGCAEGLPLCREPEGVPQIITIFFFFFSVREEY